MENKIYNLIILDESGSMSYIKPQAISGLNETLQTIKDAQEKYEDQNHYVTLVSFNTKGIKTIYDCCPVRRIKELNDNDYHPNSSTPLYDAMGISLTKLNSVVKDEDNVLVTIITDGYENASCEYSGKSISKLVEELKTKGWVFTYIGANQDVIKVASSMNIRNSLLFSADGKGTDTMFKMESESRARYYRRIDERRDVAQLDYFVDEEKKDVKEDSLNFEKEKVIKEKIKKWWWF